MEFGCSEMFVFPPFGICGLAFDLSCGHIGCCTLVSCKPIWAGHLLAQDT